MVLTAARLVCASKGLEELPHLWTEMNAYLDHSHTWTIEAAAASGLKYLVQHLALSLPKHQLQQQQHNRSLVMDFAARNGHLDILTWLHETPLLSGCSTRALDDAAKNGHLPIVQWLHANRKEGCTVKAMDYAAKNGHLQIVQWLHDHRKEGCSSRAMDLAAQNGHLHVLQWIHDNRSEGCTSSAVMYAAAEGHVHVLQWLCEQLHQQATPATMVHAARNGHISVLDYLGVHFPALFESVGAQMVHVAIANGRARVLNWLIAALPMKALKCDAAHGSWMDVAAEFGQVAILQWLHDHSTALPMGIDGRLSVCTADAIAKAAGNGHSDVLRFLDDHQLVELKTDSDAMKALVAAVERGHVECVEWLVTRFHHLYEQNDAATAAVDAAAAVGRVEILQFLLERPVTSSWRTSAKGVNEAARQGHVEVLGWIYNHHSDIIPIGEDEQEEEEARGEREENVVTMPPRWTPMALELAATNGHLNVVNWLTQHHAASCNFGEALNAAAYMDHLVIVQFLLTHFRAQCNVAMAVEHAEEGGADETLEWLQSLQ